MSTMYDQFQNFKKGDDIDWYEKYLYTGPIEYNNRLHWAIWIGYAKDPETGEGELKWETENKFGLKNWDSVLSVRRLIMLRFMNLVFEYGSFLSNNPLRVAIKIFGKDWWLKPKLKLYPYILPMIKEQADIENIERLLQIPYHIEHFMQRMYKYYSPWFAKAYTRIEEYDIPDEDFTSVGGHPVTGRGITKEDKEYFKNYKEIYKLRLKIAELNTPILIHNNITQ